MSRLLVITVDEADGEDTPATAAIDMPDVKDKVGKKFSKLKKGASAAAGFAGDALSRVTMFQQGKTAVKTIASISKDPISFIVGQLVDKVEELWYQVRKIQEFNRQQLDLKRNAGMVDSNNMVGVKLNYWTNSYESDNKSYSRR